MSEIDPNSAIFGSEPQAEKRRATLKPKKKTPAYRPGRLNRRKRHLKRARDLVSNTVQRPSVPSITSTDTSIEEHAGSELETLEEVPLCTLQQSSSAATSYSLPTVDGGNFTSPLAYAASSSSDDEESDEDNNEGSFTFTDAHPLLQEAFQSLPQSDRKKVSILIYNHLLSYHFCSKAEASQSVAIALGVGSSSLWRWNNEYFRRKGDISADRRGKYKRSSLLDQEDITRKSVAWLRGKVHDVKYHLTSTNYQAWFNEYLQTLTLPPNFPKEIS